MDPELLESLERTVNEIDALEAIYGSLPDDDQEVSQFSVVSQSNFELARHAIDGGQYEKIPQIDIEIRSVIRKELSEDLVLTLRCTLPPGYPEVGAIVAISVGGLRRATTDEISLHLKQKAESLVGMEAVMELMEEFKIVAARHIEESQTNGRDPTDQSSVPKNSEEAWGRRWIWVHHIKDTGRRKNIVNEARNLHLGGYLKSGYPGIVVVEGKASSCDEFVAWIKGNKSRPGGFGRNWGHHCRGEVNFSRAEKCLPGIFDELEDMAVLGELCRNCGLEDEFLRYVLQHKGASG